MGLNSLIQNDFNSNNPMNREFELPLGVDLEHLLQKLRSLSWGASDILLAYARGEKPPYGFSKALNINEGGDGPVSAADLAVNKWLLDGLKKEFPTAKWTLLSEESAKDQLTKGQPLNSEWLWILDPLDGTKDFLQGTGEYAVHLALVHFQRPILGVILLPESEELWFGIYGLGAWKEDRRGERAAAALSDRREPSDMRLVASRNHRDERLENLISRLSLGDVKAVGSVGCKIASILRGETDLYISLSGKSAPKDWDMAAPEAVLLAAGGSFTHADGRVLLYNTGDIRQAGCLIASNGLCHEKLCDISVEAMESIDPGFSV